MALALYRKYRPRTFAEVIGQEHVTEPLSAALRAGRLHHAYLFSGPRGCGKTSSARILARSLNCVKGPTPDPCGECEPCRSLASDGAGSIDVIEIDAASHGGVDDARDLRERAFFAPAASRYKIYVIDEAHMVSSAGFNALLKLVEEPPEFVKFVFATTEPEKVLGTIKSRTHHYPFRLIPPGVLRPFLEDLCRREGVTVEPAVFPLVVRAGGGSARDSLSVLDQLIAGAGEQGVSYAGAAALLGVTDVVLIDEMCDAVGAGDGAAAFATIDRVAEAGHDARRFASDLLERLRDLIVLQQVPDAASKGLLDAPADQLDRMALQAQRFGPAALSRCADIVHNGLVEMRGTTAPRLLLELIIARMLLPGADGSEGGLLHRLERMERRLGASTAGDPPAVPVSSAVREPAAPPAAAGGSAPIAESPPAGPARAEPAPAVVPAPPGAIDAAAVRRVWDEVLTVVGRRSKKVAAWVREATVREVDGDTLVLVFRYPFHAQALSNEPDLLVEAIYEVLGGRWQIRCELGGGGAAPSRTPAAAGVVPRPAAPVPAPATVRPEDLPDIVEEDPAPPPATARRAAAKAATAPDPSDTTDWPTTARPGGGEAGGPAADPPAPAAKAARPAKAAKGTAARSRTAGRTTRSARADKGGGPVWAEGAPDEPYDPEYDGPAGTPAYEGFDPGDEPLDEVVGEKTARQTSEQQAVQLLQEAFGAEKIGEVDHR